MWKEYITSLTNQESTVLGHPLSVIDQESACPITIKNMANPFKKSICTNLFILLYVT